MTTPAINLTYHGYECPALACGTLNGVEVYMLEMATSTAIVKRGAKRAGSANYNKAKGVVLHAGTSVGPDLATIEAIEWGAEAGELARTWAHGQLRTWLSYVATNVPEVQAYYAERVAAIEAFLAATAKRDAWVAAELKNMSHVL